MSKYQRSKILALYKILIEKSDENHKLSISDLEDLLSQENLECHRDTIRRYINQLEDELSLDLVLEPKSGKNAGYYLGTRVLDNVQMKLVLDAINASKFIAKKRADDMIENLGSTMSMYEMEKLRSSFVGMSGITKTDNMQILYTIDMIQEALEKKCQISFDYLVWNQEKELKKKEQKYKHNMFPLELIWANDWYYLYGRDVKETKGVFKKRLYRVDKLDDVKLLPNKIRKDEQKLRPFDVNKFVSRNIGMFLKEEELITVRIEPELVGTFIDQFGKDEVKIKEEKDGKLLVSFKAANSKLLYGWLIGLENVEVIEPDIVRNGVVELIRKNMKRYNSEE